MRIVKFISAVAAGLAASPAAAQPIVIADSGDTAWVLAACIFGLFAAIPGLALWHGRGRAGPTGLALFVAIALTSVLFATIGYSLIFAPGNALIGGSSALMLAGLAELRDGATISDGVHALQQLGVALFAIGLIVATLAERARVGWLVAFSGLWFLLVYVPLAHWIWGGGWLVAQGTVDMAGGIVVQISAGIASLVAAVLLGRSHETDVAYDSRLAIGGGALIWIGWLGIVGGAALAADDDAAAAIVNAQLAASAAVLAGLALERLRRGTISVYGTTVSAIAGLAAISTASSAVGAGGAMALGVIGAIAATLGAMLVERLRLGGAASGFVAHGSAGIAGAVLCPVFMLTALGGLGLDEGTSLATALVAQLVGVLVAVLWSAGLTAVAALMAAMVLPMRLREG